jgi:hypothetical protein
MLLLFLHAGCNDEAFFDLTNPPEFPWLNMNELELGVVSPYKIAMQSSWGGHFGIANRVMQDIVTDQAQLAPGTSSDYPFNELYFRRTDVPVGRIDDSFNAAYLTIGTANAVLDFLYANDREPYKSMTSTDRQNIDRMEGELLFMRAYAYYELCIMNAPPPGASGFETYQILPLRLTFPTNAAEATQAEYVPASRIYTLVVDDLKKARTLLPEAYIAGVHHPSYEFGRATRYAAAAMLARVYFHLGEHELALEALDYVISGPFALDQDPIEAFNRSDASKGNEVIWYGLYYDDIMGYTPKDPTLCNFSDYRAVNGGRGDDLKRGGWHQFPMSHALLRQIGWMDGSLNETPEALGDKRYLQLYYRLEGNNGDPDADPAVYEQQYPQIKTPNVWVDKYYRGPDGQFTNVPVLRLAEMLLTRAIIALRAGDAAQALADVNTVRQRAGLEPLPVVTEQDIHNERIKELGFEGDRLRYLQGLQRAIPPGDRDAPGLTFPQETLFWKIPINEEDYRQVFLSGN